MHHEQQSTGQQHNEKGHPRPPQKTIEEEDLHDVIIKPSQSASPVATADTGLLRKDYTEQESREEVLAYDPKIITPLILETPYLIYAKEIPYGRMLRLRGQREKPDGTLELRFTSL